ncbi:MAG: site-2 protease family protein [Ruminococcus sp.]
MCKFEVRGFEIRLFEIKIIENKRSLNNLNCDIFVTLMGPCTNILLFFIFIRFLPSFAYVNLFLGVFNMLPCNNLDGGQLIYLLLSKRLSYKSVERIIDILTVITVLPVLILGILVLLQSKNNFSLLFISLYLILSLFVRNKKYI